MASSNIARVDDYLQAVAAMGSSGSLPNSSVRM
jgi:hypothetical protein